MTSNGSKELKVPGLRAHMGDWVYYITFLRMRDIAERISLVTEIHKSSILKELIQREIERSHAEAIREYLIRQKERFFNSLVVGVYGGSPRWAELAIHPTDRKGFGKVPDYIEGALGILIFDGSERLFAIDGQHRVVGIKRAVVDKSELGDEEVSTIFVAHANNAQGMERTRRLFTTLNRYAKPVNKMQIIALDEDDVVAIVTRRLLEAHPLLDRWTSIKKGKNISSRDRKNFTTIITVYDVLDVYLPDDPKAWRHFKKSRPSDHAISSFCKQAHEFWDELMSFFPPLRELATSNPDKEIAAQYRNREGGHLLFRPVGLSALTQVTKWFTESGISLRRILRHAVRVPMSLNDEPWVGLLWDPTNKRMIVRSENQRVAQRILYYGLGGKLSRFNSSPRQLREELAGLLGTRAEEVTLHRWAEL
jgi:DNA sulfur modification protein DndB